MTFADAKRDAETVRVFDRLDGGVACDCGATDSGIKDDDFKLEVVKRPDIDDLLARLLNRYLSVEHTIRDAKIFIEWIESPDGLNHTI